MEKKDIRRKNEKHKSSHYGKEDVIFIGGMIFHIGNFTRICQNLMLDVLNL